MNYWQKLQLLYELHTQPGLRRNKKPHKVEGWVRNAGIWTEPRIPWMMYVLKFWSLYTPTAFVYNHSKAEIRHRQIYLLSSQHRFTFKKVPKPVMISGEYPYPASCLKSRQREAFRAAIFMSTEEWIRTFALQPYKSFPHFSLISLTIPYIVFQYSSLISSLLSIQIVTTYRKIISKVGALWKSIPKGVRSFLHVPRQIKHGTI